LILAILAEGAKGETYNQLSTALKLPKDPAIVRQMFQDIMERLRNTNEYKLNVPEFKNWFYVYKNYTVNEDYRKILEKHYLTEVRSVSRYDSSFFHITQESKDKEVGQIEPLPSIEIKDPIVKDIVKEEKIITFAMEDKPEKVAFEKHAPNPGKNIKEKIKLTNTKDADFEIMEAVEAKNHPRTAKGLFEKEDITNGLSSNRVGNKGKLFSNERKPFTFMN